MQRFQQCLSAHRRNWPMFGRLGIAAAALAALALALTALSDAYAQTAARPAHALITQSLNEQSLVTLSGNTRPEAKNPDNDRGRVADSLPLPHMLMQLRRPAAQEQALQSLIDQLHDPASPNYHRWLDAGQIGAQFGPAASDIAAVTDWLRQRGFTVNTVYSNGMTIDFSGTAGQVRSAFHTEIHNLSVNGAGHIANMSDPQIPAALAPVVVGIASLHDFKPHPKLIKKQKADYTVGNGDYLVTPADLATIYNFNPVFGAGNTGQNQTIYLIEDTDLYSTGDWTTFRSTFGLSGYTGASLSTIHPAPLSGPTNCSDPGTNSDDGEAILDAEWSSAAAPSAAIVMAACANSPDGILIAVQNLVNSSTTPSIMSISYGECEAGNGAASNAAYNSAYETGVAAGWSIFVSAGDEDAASCDINPNNLRAYATTHGIGVSALASTPYNVAVGGTDFSDTYSGTIASYWNASNTAAYGSALSYIPEIPWNDSCASQLISKYITGSNTTYGSSGFCNSSTASAYGLLNNVGGSGGPSGCATGSPSTSGVVSGSCTGYAKPSWQSGVIGIPSDGVRDIPDVSLFAANGVWNHYYVFCWSDPSQTSDGSAACTGAPSTWSGAGGTSFSSPIMAGVQALINQSTGARQGNPNPVYYKLAAAEYGAGGNGSCSSSEGNSVGSSCIFYDVTLGDIDADCHSSSPNCYDPSGKYGVLSTSTSSYAPAYPTQTGWDFATGIGTVNVYNLVTNWVSGGGGNAELTVSVNGSGTVTSAPSGINCGSTCSASFAGGSQVTLTATPTNGWAFTGWGGACSGTGSCVVTMNALESVVATFTQVFTLSVNDTGSGTVTSSPSGISCGSACSASFASGAQVTLNESPAGGWSFSGWSGACTGTGSCVVTMNAAESVIATFTQNSYPLSVAVSGSGTVTSSPSGISCGLTCSASFLSGTQVTLNETPGTGATFSGWSGACSGAGSCVATMNAAENVSATFTANGGGQPGGRLYVNPEVGSDTGACPQSAPCRTLNYALAQASAGGVINIETGGIFGPIYITQPITINGPTDGTASIVWSSTVPGCVAATVGSCNGDAAANYAVEIAASAANGIVELNNLLIDNNTGTNGAMHIASAYSVSLGGTVMRGGTGAAPQIMLVDTSQGSLLELFFGNCDVGFSSSGGGILVAPTAATPVYALFQNGEVHNGTFGLTFDASGLSAGANIRAGIDKTRFFSFNNSAVMANAGNTGSVNVVLSRSTVANSGGSAFNVNGSNSVGLLFKTTITGNQVGVAVASGATAYSFGNNEIFGNSTNVSGSLTNYATQ